MINKNNAGFTLVEIAIVLAIVGIIIGFSTQMLLPSLDRARVVNTQERLEKVADRLAAFAVKNNRIPCPATPDGSGVAPFGYEIDSGVNGDSPNTTCYNADTEGIIPFKTLGITEEDAKDGWGNYITYRISPVFSLDPDTVPASQYNDIHVACRGPSWFGNRERGNLNPAKARFCCPPIGIAAGSFYPSTDLSIQDESGDLHWSVIRTTDTNQYDDIDTIISDIDEIDPTENPDVLMNEAIAFVLVSHGRNQYGAFSGTGPTTRLVTNNGQSGDSEDENQNGDGIFISKKTDTTRNGSYFDDILVWRTQHQLFAEFGDTTCLNP